MPPSKQSPIPTNVPALPLEGQHGTVPLDAKTYDHEPEPTGLKGVGLGPAVIGRKQHEYNLKHGASVATVNAGPAMVLTQKQFQAWEAAGRPKDFLSFKK